MARTKEVINRVEELAESEGIDNMVNGELLFEWELGMFIEQTDGHVTITDGDNEQVLDYEKQSLYMTTFKIENWLIQNCDLVLTY